MCMDNTDTLPTNIMELPTPPASSEDLSTKKATSDLRKDYQSKPSPETDPETLPVAPFTPDEEVATSRSLLYRWFSYLLGSEHVHSDFGWQGHG